MYVTIFPTYFWLPNDFHNVLKAIEIIGPRRSTEWQISLFCFFNQTQ